MTEIDAPSDRPMDETIKIVYWLYLAGLLVGITILIGLIIAYVNKGEANEVERSHYVFQIRTFWIGLLMAVVGTLTSVIFVGFVVLLFYVVWLIVRCAKGLGRAGKGEAMPKPLSWMFG